MKKNKIISLMLATTLVAQPVMSQLGVINDTVYASTTNSIDKSIFSESITVAECDTWYAEKLSTMIANFNSCEIEGTPYGKTFKIITSDGREKEYDVTDYNDLNYTTYLKVPSIDKGKAVFLIHRKYRNGSSISDNALIIDLKDLSIQYGEYTSSSGGSIHAILADGVIYQSSEFTRKAGSTFNMTMYEFGGTPKETTGLIKLSYMLDKDDKVKPCASLLNKTFGTICDNYKSLASNPASYLARQSVCYNGEIKEGAELILASAKATQDKSLISNLITSSQLNGLDAIKLFNSMRNMGINVDTNDYFNAVYKYIRSTNGSTTISNLVSNPKAIELLKASVANAPITLDTSSKSYKLYESIVKLSDTILNKTDEVLKDVSKVDELDTTSVELFNNAKTNYDEAKEEQNTYNCTQTIAIGSEEALKKDYYANFCNQAYQLIGQEDNMYKKEPLTVYENWINKCKTINAKTPQTETAILEQYSNDITFKLDVPKSKIEYLKSLATLQDTSSASTIYNNTLKQSITNKLNDLKVEKEISAYLDDITLKVGDNKSNNLYSIKETDLVSTLELLLKKCDVLKLTIPNNSLFNTIENSKMSQSNIDKYVNTFLKSDADVLTDRAELSRLNGDVNKARECVVKLPSKDADLKTGYLSRLNQIQLINMDSSILDAVKSLASSIDGTLASKNYTRQSLMKLKDEADSTQENFENIIDPMIKSRAVSFMAMPYSNLCKTIDTMPDLSTEDTVNKAIEVAGNDLTQLINIYVSIDALPKDDANKPKFEKLIKDTISDLVSKSTNLQGEIDKLKDALKGNTITKEQLLDLVSSIKDEAIKKDIMDKLGLDETKKAEDDAKLAVEQAESIKSQASVDMAKDLVSKLTNETLKKELTDRLDSVVIDVSQDKTKEIENAITKAEQTKDQKDIDKALTLVNGLQDGLDKDNYLDRINKITNVSDDTTSAEKLSATADLILATLSENTLELVLDTNKIVFDDYNGAKDCEKTEAVTATVSSSLPYDLNVTQLDNIKGKDGNTMSDDILNFRPSGSKYSKLGKGNKHKFVENANAGKNLQTKFDIKLTGDASVKKDNYSTVLRFEAIQK